MLLGKEVKYWDLETTQKKPEKVREILLLDNGTVFLGPEMSRRRWERMPWWMKFDEKYRFNAEDYLHYLENRPSQQRMAV